MDLCVPRKEALPPELQEEIHKYADTDGNGRLSYQEFVDFVRRSHKRTCIKHIVPD